MKQSTHPVSGSLLTKSEWEFVDTTGIPISLTRYLQGKRYEVCFRIRFKSLCAESHSLIIPSRHEYLADNDVFFVLYFYPVLKSACQGLPKSETNTTVHAGSVVTDSTSGVSVLLFNIVILLQCVTDKQTGGIRTINLYPSEVHFFPHAFQYCIPQWPWCSVIVLNYLSWETVKCLVFL